MSLPIEKITELAYSDRYKEYYAELLMELLASDTTPKSDISIIRENEIKAFGIIERELKNIEDSIVIKRIPINEVIESHPYFTQPYYTKIPEKPQGLSVNETYNGRYNLVAVVKGQNESESGHKIIYNSHIDTVAPFLEYRREGDLIYGRGACDAKGQVALMLSHIKLLKELGEPINQDRIYQFVIDEEPGGNGSLSLAIDQSFKDSTDIIVFEITNNKAHPANRGALWYKIELAGAFDDKINVAEMQAYVVLALEAEGRSIKSESNHPLFPTRPVQTCQGILGSYGKHPSAVNDFVGFKISADGVSSQQLRQIIDEAVRAYCNDYGDKTKEIDPVTGKPKVEQHYNIGARGEEAKRQGGKRAKFSLSALLPYCPFASYPSCHLAVLPGFTKYDLEIFGKGGHMGAILECDDAITKGAYIIKAFKDFERKNPGTQITVAMGQDSDSRKLIIEGGQGFIPTHTIEEVQKRLNHAVAKGAQEYCQLIGVTYKPEMAITTYEKLHNDAYVSPVDCPAMQALQSAFEELGLDFGKPTAWLVSCDARIFAKEGYNVVTFGPGLLSDAHQPVEKIDIKQAQEALAISAIAALNLGNKSYET
ncbi:M20/M25/M40 family metallo-hydrolase [Candidatus Poribacteria bacterium]|nr:M20/M25/M40 family metallo-hydrolase [Candidatus Poribacteria bacterium]